MQSVSQRLMQERREKLVTLLREEPRTIKEMQDVFGGSYHAMRLDFQALAEQGVLTNCGRRAGSQLYTANIDAVTGWPMIYRNHGATEGRSLKAEVNAVRKDFYITPAIRGALIGELAFINTMLRANDAKNGDLSVPAMQDAHKNVLAALKHLRELVIRLECLADNRELWSKAGLERLGVVEDFPAKSALQDIETEELHIVNQEFATMMKNIEDRIKAYYDGKKERNEQPSDSSGSA